MGMGHDGARDHWWSVATRDAQADARVASIAEGGCGLFLSHRAPDISSRPITSVIGVRDTVAVVGGGMARHPLRCPRSGAHADGEASGGRNVGGEQFFP